MRQLTYSKNCMARTPKPKKWKWQRKKKESRWKKKEGGFNYQSVSWKFQRDEAIRRNPKCCKCGKKGKRQGNRIVGLVADHSRPVRLWPELAEAQSNLYTMCYSCHQSKSAREQRVKTQEQWIKEVWPHYKYIKIKG